MRPLKGDNQLYCDVRLFSWLHSVETWDDVMKAIAKTRDPIHQFSVNKKLKKVGTKFILLV